MIAETSEAGSQTEPKHCQETEALRQESMQLRRENDKLKTQK